MVVREVVVDQLFHLFGRLAVGLIVYAQAPLFFDRLPLVLEILLGDDQAAHAVGLQEEAQVELIFGHRLVVGRAVGVGGAVGVAAVGVDQEVELSHAHVLGALEHHVFEEVGEAGAALALILGAHLIANANRVYRRVVIFRDDHAETVIQMRVGELDGVAGRGLGGGRRLLGKGQGSRAGSSHSYAHDGEQFHETSTADSFIMIHRAGSVQRGTCAGSWVLRFFSAQTASLSSDEKRADALTRA